MVSLRMRDWYESLVATWRSPMAARGLMAVLGIAKPAAAP